MASFYVTLSESVLVNDVDSEDEAIQIAQDGGGQEMGSSSQAERVL